MLKEFNFELGEVWNYDPHGVIYMRRREINASVYEIDSKPKLEWKTNLDSLPINTEMEVKTLATKDKN